MPAPYKPAPTGESCGSCFYSHTTAYGSFCCCFNAPTANSDNTAVFPQVDPDLSWCRNWSQTSARSNVVLQTNCALSNNSTTASLSTVDNLISGKYYSITGSGIASGTLFLFNGNPIVQLSIPASANATVQVTISDSYHV